MMKYGVLGPLTATRHGELIDLSRPLERRLLAVLLTNRARATHDDEIINALWPAGLPGYPGQALRTSVSRLRKMLGASELIVRAGGGYRLLLEPGSVDADRFEALLMSGEPEHRAARLREALDLWTSDEPYADFRYEDFVQGEAQRLRALRLQAFEDLASERLAAGESHVLIPDLQMMLAQHPHRESLYHLLMLSQYRSGQQPEALRTFQAAKTALGEDLGLEPSKDLIELEAQILLEDPRLVVDSPSPPNNIPSRITSIIGRDEDIESLVAQLRDRRLVTVTGPVGVGKSTAAIETASRVVACDQLEAWYVDLASVDTDDDVPSRVTDRLSMLLQNASEHEWESFQPGMLIGTTRMLIVLDNCEHVLSGVSFVAARILEECPNVTILATSRERLGLAGELVYALEPLSSGVAGEAEFVPGLAIESYPALRLFLDRAKAASPGFDLPPAHVPIALELCRKLDGLPLALELAAARIDSFTIPEVERWIDGYFRVLGSQRGVEPRHQSLEVAVAWSYDLLEPPQQEHLQALSCVIGTFTATDAMTLLAVDDESLAGAALASLHEKSLIRSTGHVSEEGRFVMLRTVRDFALARADDAGRLREYAMRHARSFSTMAAEASRHLTGGPHQLYWMNRCEESTPDLLQAAETLIGEHDVEGAVDIVAAVGAVWTRHRYQTSAYPTIRNVLVAAGAAIFDSTPRAHVIASWIRTENPELQFRDGLTHARQALHAAEVVGDEDSAAIATGLLGLNSLLAGQIPEARELVEAACGMAERDEETWAETFVLVMAGLVEHALEPSAGTYSHLERAAELAVMRSDEPSVAWANGLLGSALKDVGLYARAQAAFNSAHLAGRRIADPKPAILGAAGAALVSWLRGDFPAAVDSADRGLKLLEPLSAEARYDSVSLPFLAPGRIRDIDSVSEALDAIYELPSAEQPVAFIRYLLETAEMRAIDHLDAARVAEIRAGLELLNDREPSMREVTRR